MANGFNQPTPPTNTQPPIVDHSPSVPYSSWLNSGVTMRDFLVNSFEVIDTSFLRDFYLVQYSSSGSVTTKAITPKPYIDRIGSTSKPYRLLSGQEVQLSENDLRVRGISKRYALSEVWQWGTLYCTNPVFNPDGSIDLDSSTLYELIFIDDSNPLYWVLNLRQKTDSRYNGAEYDLP
jgi:hypothetical protein